jgi:hypothetical protein
MQVINNKMYYAHKNIFRTYNKRGLNLGSTYLVPISLQLIN